MSGKFITGKDGTVEDVILNSPSDKSSRYKTMGYALAARVLQSGLYQQLDDRERAECDELLAQGQRPSVAASGETPRTKARWEAEWKMHAQSMGRSSPAQGMCDWAEELERELAEWEARCECAARNVRGTAAQSSTAPLWTGGYSWVKDACEVLRWIEAAPPEIVAKINDLLIGVPCPQEDLGFNSPADRAAQSATLPTGDVVVLDDLPFYDGLAKKWNCTSDEAARRYRDCIHAGRMDYSASADGTAKP